MPDWVHGAMKFAKYALPALLILSQPFKPAQSRQVDKSYCDIITKKAAYDPFLLLIKDEENPFLVHWDPLKASTVGVYFGGIQELRAKGQSGMIPYLAPDHYILINSDAKGVLADGWDIDNDGYLDLSLDIVHGDGRCEEFFYKNTPDKFELVPMKIN
jgi:hypothetical protein